ncbi:MAG: CDP-alcohol phosphatidyltransferase [Candidatus Wolfebacteria bacterium GW2011_GWC1_37_10]|uniref:CDP-alcohol phosphatidyltransferase n=1 Tax=Candidatus Wolfebacteria bacterium GW2011_GWC1_37_10 TaxID=1619010 RepID=A0A0G0IC37_9BACT|nr:MAG: CDP-alcohol phosphatidyltransferase [Candidatus Wolfebacteria bacterium GW2011_GWC1_37_10]
MTNLNIPNGITVSGIVAVLVYVFGYLTNNAIMMIIGFSWTGLSDLLDGFLARRLHQETKLGEFLDPLRDRLLLIAVAGNIISISGLKSILNLWSLILGLTELGIIMMVVSAHVARKIQLKVNIVGKIRQTGHLILMIMVIVDFYAGFNPFNLSLNSVLKMMAVLSFASFTFYLGRYLTSLKRTP